MSPPIADRACDPEEHVFRENRSGMKFCTKCEISRQSLSDVVGQDLLGARR